MSNTQTNVSINRQHKDRLFTMIFGDNKNQKNILSLYNVKDAIELAINECIEENVLTDFLKKQRGDVMLTCLTEFSEELYKKGLLEKGRELGL